MADPRRFDVHAHHFAPQSFSPRRPARLRGRTTSNTRRTGKRIAAQRPNDEAGVPQISMDASQVPVRACASASGDFVGSSSSDSRQRFIASLTEL